MVVKGLGSVLEHRPRPTLFLIRDRSYAPRMKRGLAVIAASGLAVAACGSSSGGGSSEPPSPLDTPKTATCQDWLDATQDQRDEAALRFAKVLHAVDQSTAFAHRFAVDISRDCGPAHTLRLPEVVGALATIDTDDFPH